MPRHLPELDDYENVMIAVLAVALVWLLLRDLNVNVNISRQGFTAFARWGKDELAYPKPPVF